MNNIRLIMAACAIAFCFDANLLSMEEKNPTYKELFDYEGPLSYKNAELRKQKTDSRNLLNERFKYCNGGNDLTWWEKNFWPYFLEKAKKCVLSDLEYDKHYEKFFIKAKHDEKKKNCKNSNNLMFRLHTLPESEYENTKKIFDLCLEKEL